MTQYRQGDVLIQTIAEVPKTAQPVAPEGGRVVLAHGEATGHSHAFRSDRVRMFRDAAGGYLQVEGDHPAGLVPGRVVPDNLPGILLETDIVPTATGRIRFAAANARAAEGGVIADAPWSPLHHEEHHAEAIRQGTYKLPRQREFRAGLARRVAD